jgi:taurine dioxygenase
MEVSTISVTPLSEVMGAEINGVDLSKPLGPSDVGVILEAFHTYQVLAVRDQRLSPAEQVRFSRYFGELEKPNNIEFAIAEEPHVLVLSNGMKDGKPIGVIDAGDYWHSDSSHRSKPSAVTILHAIKNPSRGGNTHFSNMHLAYEALPAEMQRRLEHLSGVHNSNKLKNKRVTVSAQRPGAREFYESRSDRPDVTHPLVRIHPVTKRKALFCSPRFTIAIADLPDGEGQALLEELFAHQTKPPFRYTHHYRDGDVVIWDNRCLIHLAGGGYRYPDVRVMHRTVVAGERTHVL